MNIEENLVKLNKMKMHGMSRAYQALLDTNTNDSLSNDEFIGHLIDAEWEERYNRKLNRLLSYAKLRYTAYFEQIDYRQSRGLNKNKMARFSNATWLGKENIIMTGATGVGKSYLACAIGHQACINEARVMYFNCMKLFSFLKLAKADGTYFKEIDKIKRQDLIILDDFGLQKLDTTGRLILLEILEDRYKKSSTIIISQLPINKWHPVIGDATIADAICDRLVHNSHIIKLKGESLRKLVNK